MNRIHYIFLISSIFLLLLPIGCNNEGNLGPANEEFVGVYLMRDTQIAMSEKIDSVIFTVFRNTTFSMIFYEGEGSGKDVDFCNCQGNIIDFGTAKASFDPTSISYGNCDTLRIPRGLFSADFINYDSVIVIEKREPYSDVDDTLYQLILLK